MWACVTVEMRSCGDVDYVDMEMCRCVDVEMCRCGDVEMKTFSVDISSGPRKTRNPARKKCTRVFSEKVIRQSASS